MPSRALGFANPFLGVPSTGCTKSLHFHTLMMAKLIGSPTWSSIPEALSSSLNARCSFHCPRPHQTISQKFSCFNSDFLRLFLLRLVKFKFFLLNGNFISSLRLRMESIMLSTHPSLDMLKISLRTPL